jgi:3-phenylpropionate/cinnamic acid dioxygenase small subunit
MRRELVEDFLFAEAWLLDHHRYKDWLELCTDDIVYWVPGGSTKEDPEDQISLIYDNRARLEHRLERFAGEWVFSQDPFTVMNRGVTNVQLRPADSGWVPEAAAADLAVRCRIHVAEVRRKTVVTWVATTDYRLRLRNADAEDPLDRFRIAYKKVSLVNRDEELPVIAFML